MDNFDELEQALHYMKMGELKAVCEKLKIPSNDKKAVLIRSIMSFIQTGAIKKTPAIPAGSKAQKGVSYPLHPKTLILDGAYRNDLKTRLFFKQLIGPHFHFTAFGQDWIRSRWQAGDPPTYAEFAKFWQEEHLRREKGRTVLKKEWAYLNFIRKFTDEHPEASKKQMLAAWEKTRRLEVQKARKLLLSFC
jgi:hypothetical protein